MKWTTEKSSVQEARKYCTGYSNTSNCRSMLRQKRYWDRRQTKNREEGNMNKSENTVCRICSKISNPKIFLEKKISNDLRLFKPPYSEFQFLVCDNQHAGE
jgi:hypothetical protein